MGDRIVEKGASWNVMVMSMVKLFMIIPFFVSGYIFIEDMYLGIFTMIMFSIFLIPVMIVGGFICYKFPNRIIVEEDFVTFKRTIFSNVVLPLKDIINIKKQKLFLNIIYEVSYDNKGLYLNPYYFRFYGDGFDKFIRELQSRVDKAKGINEVGCESQSEALEKAFTKADLNPNKK